MIKSTENIGQVVHTVRKKFGITQSDLALSAGTGLRFIIELEKGKATCQIDKAKIAIQNIRAQWKMRSKS